MKRAESVKLLEAVKPGPSLSKRLFREATQLYPREAAASSQRETVAKAGQAANGQEVVSPLQNHFQNLDSAPIIHIHCLTNLRNFIQQEGVSPLEVEKVKIVAGRLALFRDNWPKVTRDSWVLDTVMEYGIEFLVNPSQHTRPRVGVLTPAEQHLLQQEIQKLLFKGAITEVAAKEAGRASTRDCS